MSDTNLDRIEELSAEDWSLPHGEVQVRLLEEAVRLADVVRDQDLMFRTRLSFIHSAVFSGHTELALPAFAWCLAQFESDPSRYQRQQHSVLWSFKYILHFADNFPQLTRDQVERLEGQMAEIYDRCGYNMRPVHYVRLGFATGIGDRELAKESFANYRAVPRDTMADCIACEADGELEYYALIDEPEKAVKAVEPSLAGQRTCAEVPHRTYSDALRPLALLERYKEADEYQRKGYRLIRNNPKFLQQVAWQMAYLVHRERREPALRMLERHLPWALDTYYLRNRYLFYVSAKRTLNCFVGKRRAKKLHLPSTFPAFSPTGSYDLAELIAWFDSELKALGARFDARNQNDFFTRDLVERLQY